MLVIQFDLMERASEQFEPSWLAEYLASSVNGLRTIVGACGGEYFQTIEGHGVAIFGLTGESSHVDSAIDCAIELQRAHLQRCRDACNRGDLFFPIRIGVATGPAACLPSEFPWDTGRSFVGPLHRDASCLAEACISHGVLLSIVSIDCSSKYSDRLSDLAKKNITPGDQGLSAYEYDPFVGTNLDQGPLSEAVAALASTPRLDQRWPVPEGAGILVTTEYGAGALADFSLLGFGADLPQYLAPGFILPVRIKFSDHVAHERLVENGLDQIHARVCWSRQCGSSFRHGFTFQKLQKQKAQILLEILRTVFDTRKTG